MASRQLDEEAIFHIARDLADAAKRATYLDQVCAGDRALRDRVEGLLEVEVGPQPRTTRAVQELASVRVSGEALGGPALEAVACGQVRQQRMRQARCAQVTQHGTSTEKAAVHGSGDGREKGV